MFFEIYWQYFAVGILIYISARITYTIYKESRQNGKCFNEIGSNDEDIQTTEQSKFMHFINSVYLLYCYAFCTNFRIILYNKQLTDFCKTNIVYKL